MRTRCSYRECALCPAANELSQSIKVVGTDLFSKKLTLFPAEYRKAYRLASGVPHDGLGCGGRLLN
jgi:hypothetical protein